MPNNKFNEYCENLLVQYKRRNGKAVTRHLNSLCNILRHDDDHVVQTKFGGSVQKGTYVTGLSDVDALLIVNQSTLKNKSPSKVIQYVGNTIQRRLPKHPVHKGKLAVTVTYADKAEIQILPAIRTTDGFRIAEPGSSQWSNVVHPERFAEELIKVNNARGGRVVPAIKFAKALADCFITSEKRKIKGYHMESLAVGAFKCYKGELDSRSMLLHFLKYAIKAVLNPIPDPTGQSTYVDEYLGEAGSKLRKGASTHFRQIRSKVRSCETKAEFNDLFGIGD